MEDHHGVTLFEPDEFGQINKVTFPNGQSISYSYDKEKNLFFILIPRIDLSTKKTLLGLLGTLLMSKITSAFLQKSQIRKETLANVTMMQAEIQSILKTLSDSYRLRV
jgi:hypothetical protein